MRSIPIVSIVDSTMCKNSGSYKATPKMNYNGDYKELIFSAGISKHV